MYKTTCTCLLLRDLLEGRHGDGRTSPVMSEEREGGKKMSSPKINTAPPSGLRLNGVCENRKRNSGVKQIE